jgi:hypothetical protein
VGRRLLLSLSLGLLFLAPQLGAAQDLGPETVARPPTQYSRYRSTWYVGFGLGGGYGLVTDNNAAFRPAGTGGLSALVLRIGWVPLPWLLFGLDASGWISPSTDRSVLFQHYDLVLTVFPLYDKGLYGKLGLGAGIISVTRGSGQGPDDKTSAGVDLKTGLGYEFQVSRALNLGLETTYTLTGYSGGATHEVCGQVTLTWY